MTIFSGVGTALAGPRGTGRAGAPGQEQQFAKDGGGNTADEQAAQLGMATTAHHAADRDGHQRARRRQRPVAVGDRDGTTTNSTVNNCSSGQT